MPANDTQLDLPPAAPASPLAVVPPANLASAPAVSVGQMLQATIERGVTAENVAVLERMMDLYERTQAKDAEKAFARAFNALQSEMPVIQALREVPDKHGNLKYTFAPYEDIMAQVRPLLLKHGFTVSFSLSFLEGRVTQKCTLMHVDGHSRSNEFSVRIGSGPPGCSESQADGAAGTYAKRHALCNALNIVVDRDTDGVPTDAREIGAPITPDKVQYLREQCRELGGNTEASLLKIAGVEKFEQIGTSVYPVLVRMLQGRRNAAKSA